MYSIGVLPRYLPITYYYINMSISHTSLSPRLIPIALTIKEGTVALRESLWVFAETSFVLVPLVLTISLLIDNVLINIPIYMSIIVSGR